MDPFKPYEPRRTTPPPKLSNDDAEIIGIKAIGFITADDALLSQFVSLTGCGLETLRQRVRDPAFLGAVLDFLLADEATVVAFSEATGLHGEAAKLARMKLP